MVRSAGDPSRHRPRSNFPGQERGACWEVSETVVIRPVADAVGFTMQSTDLGNKESGKIWHRKPSPATRDG